LSTNGGVAALDLDTAHGCDLLLTDVVTEVGHAIGATTRPPSWEVLGG
jgi:hypothetical protein